MTWEKLQTVTKYHVEVAEYDPNIEFILVERDGELWMNKKLKVPGYAQSKLPGGKQGKVKKMKKGKRGY